MSKEVTDEIRNQAMAVAGYAQNDQLQNIRTIMRAYSDSQKLEIAKIAIKACQDSGRSTGYIIRSLPESALKDNFIMKAAKESIDGLASQADGVGILLIVEAFPEKDRAQFKNEVKKAIPVLITREAVSTSITSGNGHDIAKLIKAFPGQESEFKQIVKNAIPELAKNGDGYGIARIIEAFPESQSIVELAKKEIPKLENLGDKHGINEMRQAVSKTEEARKLKEESKLSNRAAKAGRYVYKMVKDNSPMMDTGNASPTAEPTAGTGKAKGPETPNRM
jgi:hypothetical protein